MSSPPGAAIEWLVRPWTERRGAAARAGRIGAVTLALTLTLVPAMIAYFGVEGWWWDGTLLVPPSAILGVIGLDAIAEGIDRWRGRRMTGLVRISALLLGLALGVLLGYLALLRFGWSADLSVEMVLRDYRRTMTILAPIVALVTVAGTSLWYRAEAYRQESAAATASFAVLTAQMQPHLLFNALNALTELILDDPPRAREFAQRIADLYRLILSASSRATSSLAQEVELVGHYLEIEAVRYGDRLRHRLDVPDELRNVEIPSLMLQTLAENAVRHGIAKSRRGGEVRLEVSRTAGGMVALELSNTGAPHSPSGEDGRTTPPLGLANTRARLRLLFGEQATMTLFSDDERGTVVRVHMPERSVG